MEQAPVAQGGKSPKSPRESGIKDQQGILWQKKKCFDGAPPDSGKFFDGVGKFLSTM
jgi:hypothetical protein